MGLEFKYAVVRTDPGNERTCSRHRSLPAAKRELLWFSRFQGTYSIVPITP